MRRSVDPPIRPTVDFLRQRLATLEPRVAIVLGSGLGGLADSVTDAQRIPYRDIPGFPEATVAGHAGLLVAGGIEGMPVLLQSGRFHLYEGHEPATVALPVRVFAELGIRTLIVTNAAGGLRPTFRVPTLMLIADHINLLWRNPLLGTVVAGEQRFPDMSEPYDRELRAIARRVALSDGIVLEEGVYAGLLGPSYETPAEIRMLMRLGADSVGMSTVPETITARARGMRVLGISSITNLAAGLSARALSHAEVMQASELLAGQLQRLVRGVVRQLG
ncbi:MAG: purine-nucleoside phosphorylase [Gemmatimonadetes bacterium]|nr:purine-nucleoside phosphorylase [Gemmatimonadota bacterium]